MSLVWFMSAVTAKCSANTMEYTRRSVAMIQNVAFRHCEGRLFMERKLWAHNSPISGQVDLN